MRRKKIILFAGIACCLIAAAWGYHLYTKQRTTASELSADVKVDAVKLYDAFAANEQAANKQYLDKIVEVTGVVADVQQAGKGGWGILLSSGPNTMGGVSCSLMNANAVSIPIVGTKVCIKGRCAGFLADVNITDAVVVQ